jgi:hypothetical protein
MSHAGQCLSNPVTGERVVVRIGDEEPDYDGVGVTEPFLPVVDRWLLRTFIPRSPSASHQSRATSASSSSPKSTRASPDAPTKSGPESRADLPVVPGSRLQHDVADRLAPRQCAAGTRRRDRSCSRSAGPRATTRPCEAVGRTAAALTRSRSRDDVPAVGSAASRLAVPAVTLRRRPGARRESAARVSGVAGWHRSPAGADAGGAE